MENTRFLEWIEDSNMIELLNDHRNLPLLEEVLAQESRQLHHLQNLKDQGRLDFGEPTPKRELSDRLIGVAADVNSFLGVDTLDMPSIRYIPAVPVVGKVGFGVTIGLGLAAYFFGEATIAEGITSAEANEAAGYFFGSLLLLPAGLGLMALGEPGEKGNHYVCRTLYLKREPRAESIISTAHEFTHHALRDTVFADCFPDKHSSFQEGTGRGVERHIARKYALKENNEAFLYGITEVTVQELKLAYQWISARHGTKPNEKLLGEQFKSTPGRLSYHQIGNAIFSMYEFMLGPQFYRNAVQGTFDFSKAPGRL